MKVPASTEAGDAPDGKAEEREYREYLSDEQRSQPGCSAGRNAGGTFTTGGLDQRDAPVSMTLTRERASARR